MWEYALGGIPTHHLEECFRRAVRANDGKFMVLATQINQQYTDMLPELQRAAQANAQQQERLLMSGHGSLGYMSLEEWKARHNLPVEWRLGDPYPPESDLHGAPLPPVREEVYRCARCRDAVLLKAYPPGPDGRLHPYTVTCPECGGEY